MAFESSLNSEFYKEFLDDYSRKPESSELGGSTGNKGGSFFGQKAPLKLNAAQVSGKTLEKPKRQWSSSNLSFSGLAGSTSVSSPLKVPFTSTRSVAGTSCDGSVETDSARSHPNSGTNGESFPRSLFNSKSVQNPYGEVNNLFKSDPLDPFLPPMTKKRRARPHQRKMADISDLPSVPLFGSRVSSPFSFSERVTAVPPHTPSPTSPPTHPHLSRSSHSSTPAHETSISDYDFLDTEVEYDDPEDDSCHTGVVTKVSDKMATVKDQSSGETRKISCSDLRLVCPRANDVVKVVGSNTKVTGKIGTLISFTEACGVVQFLTINGNVGHNLAQVKLSQLAKYVKPKSPSFELSTSASNSTSKSVWGSAVLCGTSFPFAPCAIPAVPFQLPLGASSIGSSLPLFTGSFPSSTSNNSLSFSSLEPARANSEGPTHYKNPKSGMPLSFQICPGQPSLSDKSSLFNGSLLLSKPISRGGSDGVATGERSGTKSGSLFRRTSCSSPQDVPEVIERLLANQRSYCMKKEDDSHVDVQASLVRVSLICPISQKRLKYPARGFQCKHLQCFDAEAYILMNLNHKPKARVKQADGRSLVQPLPNKKWHCPICFKHVHESQLYIDRSLRSVITELHGPITEVELSESGTWQPYKKVVTDVIDLTADDD